MIHRNQKYLDWLRTQPSVAPEHSRSYMVGDMVYAHQRIPGGNGGTGIKPHDTFALPLTQWEHLEEHRGPKRFWGNVDRHRLIVEHVARYLESQGYNGWQEIAVAITERMEGAA